MTLRSHPQTTDTVVGRMKQPHENNERRPR
jgi:hypothetical protein